MIKNFKYLPPTKFALNSENPRTFSSLYNVYRDKMFTIEKEDGREKA